MLTRTLTTAAVAAAAVLTIGGSAQAASYFSVDAGPTPGGALGFADAYGVMGESGQVDRPNDVYVGAGSPAWFKAIKSKVKPVTGGVLDTVTFRADQGTRFDGFSFRAKDAAPDQNILVTVKPWGGKKETFDFFVADNSAATPRLGIIGDDADARIKWVQVSTPDGFIKLKEEQFLIGSGHGQGPSFNSESTFNGGGADGVRGVPEPATWAMLIAGFAGIGAALRSRRRSLAIA
ncbi:MAG TPA: PEPxxWA-CTERM sorting domain-containing protein [Caulobacteraceae bacterium]|nr:PEPxxWA-CTERM sorting domain-containing protein [Caulobacteraceae bacterium]